MKGVQQNLLLSRESKALSYARKVGFLVCKNASFLLVVPMCAWIRHEASL